MAAEALSDFQAGKEYLIKIPTEGMRNIERADTLN